MKIINIKIKYIVTYNAEHIFYIYNTFISYFDYLCVYMSAEQV